MATFADLREIVLALPGVQEQETWGDVTFRVRDKIIVISGEESDGASIKASLESQAELIAADPATFQRSAYVGRYGWVRAQLANLDRNELRELVIEAWRRTATKAAVREFDARPAPGEPG